MSQETSGSNLCGRTPAKGLSLSGSGPSGSLMPGDTGTIGRAHDITSARSGLFGSCKRGTDASSLFEGLSGDTERMIMPAVHGKHYSFQSGTSSDRPVQYGSSLFGSREDQPRAEAMPTASGVDSKDRNTLHDLIALQTFSGAWALVGLKSSIGVLGQDEEITLFVLVFLQVHYGQQRDVWELVAGKARRWLAEENGKEQEVNILIKRAEQRLLCAY
ncbi:hypothetical protein LTR62_007051 [Meristemomyces frigidus]|uniref:Uncharacterized protein n=1 Tax=Meristemomyces frigidus TaxID=1508187 RepID=A0AAN7TMS0_9PEZI|nr:hypothetical protein LTR62_007051 [Meristemomyces frigidus]